MPRISVANFQILSVILSSIFLKSQWIFRFFLQGKFFWYQNLPIHSPHPRMPHKISVSSVDFSCILSYYTFHLQMWYLKSTLSHVFRIENGNLFAYMFISYFFLYFRKKKRKEIGNTYKFDDIIWPPVGYVHIELVKWYI